MTWSIPAKTFLLGEYAAIAGAPAIVLTTSPCFKLTLSDKAGLHGIHPESPAGRWWLAHGREDMGLEWYDPYQGRGGMGASSAQFLGAYLASLHGQKGGVRQEEMLDAYLQSAWSGEGLRPSGYDVLAQSLHGCVYIDRQTSHCQIFSWPFQDMTFLLLHTGKKLATHHHLQTMVLPSEIHSLALIVDRAKRAFESADSALLVDAVNGYHQQLKRMNLVAERSLEQIALLGKHHDVLAIKGCGAMGADVLLLLVQKKKQAALCEGLVAMGWSTLATSVDLWHGFLDKGFSISTY